ncbi:hypothetical protein J437_LFUL001772, partial [Ladona fulva]
MFASPAISFDLNLYSDSMEALFVDFQACVDDTGKFVLKEEAVLVSKNFVMQPWIRAKRQNLGRWSRVFQDFITGVNAADTLPVLAERPCAFIASTYPKNKPGEHWVVFFIDGNGVCEYFDSFGEPLIIVHHKMFIKRNSNQSVYNNSSLQSPTSSVCGHYCL